MKLLILKEDTEKMVQQYNINELKKELKLSNKEIAKFFNMTYGSFANSSAKQRYEAALCKFYSFLRGREKNLETIGHYETKELSD